MDKILIFTLSIIVVIGFMGWLWYPYILDIISKKKKTREGVLQPLLPLEKRIQNTNEMMVLINKLIDMESASILKECLSLNRPYKIMLLDDHIEEIGNKVFVAFAKSIYTSNDTVFTEDYLMSYIVQSTTLIFLSDVLKLNDNLVSMYNE